MKIKTTKGIINNNTIKHKITRDTATIFNFCIDEVTLADGTLSVSCTTLAGDVVEYSLDISSDTKELPVELENLNVAGDVNLFLALAYRIYESGLEPSEDMPSGDCTELQARIAELEAMINPDILSVYDINLAELSITEFGGGVNGNTIGGGSIKIGLYPGSDDIVLTRLRELISVVSVEVNDNAVSVNNSTVYSSGININISFSTTYNDTPIPISVTIKNNETNKEYTITDSISVENGQIVLNGGGAVVTNDNLIIDNTEYKITLQASTTNYANNGIEVIITNLSTDENTTIQELGFNTRRGNALHLNENTNETIEADLQINNTTPTGDIGYDGQTIMSNQNLQDNDKITITLTHKDQNQNTIQTITKKATYHKNLT